LCSSIRAECGGLAIGLLAMPTRQLGRVGSAAGGIVRAAKAAADSERGSRARKAQAAAKISSYPLADRLPHLCRLLESVLAQEVQLVVLDP
jgi:hypothetical protein